MAFTRLVGILAAAALCLGASAPAQAQKTVRMLVGFPAGQTTDLVARIVAERLATALGYPVIVENRPGQGGSLALGLLAKSPADGSVMSISALASFVANPHLYKSVPYNTLKDFDPVALILDIPIVMVTHPSLPVASVADLVKYAKDNPDKLTHSSSGNGTISHLAMEDFKRRAGIKIVHAPYQGSAKAMLDLMAGNVQVAMDAVAVTQTHIQAGKMRLLAVGSSKRMSLYPDTPTVAELGHPGFEAVAWIGAVLPAGSPPELRERLSTEIVRIVRAPEFEQRMTALGMVTRPAGSAEFGAYLKSEHERWGRIVRESGARVE
jgi:tripartite-type tricarboxylate transporter receptor subunit TctC